MRSFQKYGGNLSGTKIAIGSISLAEMDTQFGGSLVLAKKRGHNSMAVARRCRLIE